MLVRIATLCLRFHIDFLFLFLPSRLQRGRKPACVYAEVAWGAGAGI